MTLHFFNDVANDAESTQNQKLRHNRCFEEWSTMGKLINIEYHVRVFRYQVYQARL